MLPPALALVAHDDVIAYVQAIADAIEADDWHPDLLVGIGRGGLVPATFLSHRLALPLVSLDLSAGVPDFGADLLPRLAVIDRRLLLIDDINDSGRTIAQLRAALPAARVAVLIDNLRSTARADYAGRTIDRAGDKSWFVFPWEALAPSATILVDAQAVPARLA